MGKPTIVSEIDAPSVVAWADVSIEFGSIRALRQVNGELGAQQVAAVLGPSGSGKQRAESPSM